MINVSIIERIKILFAEFKKSSFVKNVVTIATGTALAQAISMATSPLITRLYGPEAFGTLGVYVSIVGIMSPIVSLCYPIAIPIPEKDDEALGVIRLSLCIALFVSTVVMIAFLIGGEWITYQLKLKSIENYIYLIPFSLFLDSILQNMQQWNIRKKRYYITARIAVIQAVFINIIKVIVGFLKPLGGFLILISTFATFFQSLLFWFASQNSLRIIKQNSKHSKKLLLMSIANRYYDFPAYRAPQVFINAISQGLPVLMLTSLFGATSAGYYTLCRTILGIPSTLIGSAIGDVLYPKLIEGSNRNEDLSKIIIKTTLALSTVSCIPFGTIFFLGPCLFGFVFGEKWTAAGEYARWLSLWIFFMFINRPSVVAIPVLNIQKGLLIYEIVSTGLKLLALYIGFYLLNNDISAIIIFSLFGSISYIYLIMWVIYIASKRKVAL